MAKDKYEGIYLAPTPEIGECVQWYPNNEKSAPRAAVVTAIDGPGMIRVHVWMPDLLQPRTYTGVHHTGNPCHTPDNANTREMGSWDFPPKAADRMKLAREVADRKLRQREEQELAKMQQEEDRAKKLKESKDKELVSV